MVKSSGNAGGLINLREVKALCVDSNPQGLDIITQILMGFGVEKIIRATTGSEARTTLSREVVDLMICDAQLSDMSGNDLVEWLRATKLDPNRYIPVLLASGHTPTSSVEGARDSGANFVLAKPMTAAILMDRILWVAKGGRGFIETQSYVGPDRRWKHEGVPGGGRGRRRDDLSSTIGKASEPNLSQAEINAVVKPQRASL